mmetsp:Transcript_19589/g.59296  ORF Transcript_19589/g.59296 Transcript_19589/m.59296 type:complete len:639 (+) Transcript_19589:28-1944(+)
MAAPPSRLDTWLSSQPELVQLSLLGRSLAALFDTMPIQDLFYSPPGSHTPLPMATALRLSQHDRSPQPRAARPAHTTRSEGTRFDAHIGSCRPLPDAMTRHEAHEHRQSSKLTSLGKDALANRDSDVPTWMATPLHILKEHGNTSESPAASPGGVETCGRRSARPMRRHAASGHMPAQLSRACTKADATPARGPPLDASHWASSSRASLSLHKAVRSPREPQIHLLAESDETPRSGPVTSSSAPANVVGTQQAYPRVTSSTRNGAPFVKWTQVKSNHTRRNAHSAPQMRPTPPLRAHDCVPKDAAAANPRCAVPVVMHIPRPTVLMLDEDYGERTEMDDLITDDMSDSRVHRRTLSLRRRGPRSRPNSSPARSPTKGDGKLTARAYAVQAREHEWGCSAVPLTDDHHRSYSEDVETTNRAKSAPNDERGGSHSASAQRVCAEQVVHNGGSQVAQTLPPCLGGDDARRDVAGRVSPRAVSPRASASRSRKLLRSANTHRPPLPHAFSYCTSDVIDTLALGHGGGVHNGILEARGMPSFAAPMAETSISRIDTLALSSPRPHTAQVAASFSPRCATSTTHAHAFSYIESHASPATSPHRLSKAMETCVVTRSRSPAVFTIVGTQAFVGIGAPQKSWKRSC